MHVKAINKIVVANLVLAILYVTANWVEYSAISNQYVVAYFPTNINYTIFSDPGMDLIILPNLTLIVFIATIV